jgi:hypothetical protein
MTNDRRKMPPGACLTNDAPTAARLSLFREKSRAAFLAARATHASHPQRHLPAILSLT